MGASFGISGFQGTDVTQAVKDRQLIIPSINGVAMEGTTGSYVDTSDDDKKLRLGLGIGLGLGLGLVLVMVVAVVVIVIKRRKESNSVQPF